MTTSTTPSCNYRRRRSPALAKRHGGKFYLARRICEQLPTGCREYREPYLGMGSVFFNLAPHMYCEATLTETNLGIVQMFRMVRDRVEEFQGTLREMEYSKATFLKWRDISIPDDLSPFGQAMRCYVVSRMSRGGLGKDFAWSDRQRGGRPGDLNAWLNGLAALPTLSEMLQGTVIAQCDAELAIRAIMDDPEVFCYLDPTYHPDCRTAKGAYDEDEMTPEQHESLLNLITQCRCKVAISHYRHPLYEQRLTGWPCVQWDMPNHSGQGRNKARRIECLWRNYAL